MSEGIQANQAYTDLYDEIRHSYMVIIPLSFLIGLVLSGVIAFMCVGYWGYKNDGLLQMQITYKGMPIFVWFVLLQMFLFLMIFRHPTLRRIRNFMLTCSALSALCAIVFLYLQLGNINIINIPQSPFLELGSLIGFTIVFFAGSVIMFPISRNNLPLNIMAVPLILFSELALAYSAYNIEVYLHLNALPLSGSLNEAFLRSISYAASAIIGGTIGMLGSFLAAGIIVFQSRVVVNSMRFVPVLFSIAFPGVPILAFLNALTWFLGISPLTPFFQPNVGSLLTITLFLVSGFQLFQRQRKRIPESMPDRVGSISI